jgi:hypothetical protein
MASAQSDLHLCLLSCAHTHSLARLAQWGATYGYAFWAREGAPVRLPRQVPAGAAALWSGRRNGVCPAVQIYSETCVLAWVPAPRQLYIGRARCRASHTRVGSPLRDPHGLGRRGGLLAREARVSCVRKPGQIRCKRLVLSQTVVSRHESLHAYLAHLYHAYYCLQLHAHVE